MLQQDVITDGRLGFSTEVFGAGDAPRRPRTLAIGLLAALFVAALPLTQLLMREAALTRFRLVDPGPYLWGDEEASSAAGPDLPPPVITLQAVDRNAARAINAALPFSRGSLTPAPPFVLAAGEPLDAALGCLAEAVYFESASEPRIGQEAVAQVVLNRVRTRGYPKSVCGVVHQGGDLRTGCQFTSPCEGSLGRRRIGRAWAVAESVARAALDGFVMTGVGRATHYHTDWVAPRWNASLDKVAQIGAHIFYRWRGPSFSAAPPPGASFTPLPAPIPVKSTPTASPLETLTLTVADAPAPPALELTRAAVPVLVAESPGFTAASGAPTRGRRLAVPADW